jgi:hypothetical protein
LAERSITVLAKSRIELEQSTKDSEHIERCFLAVRENQQHDLFLTKGQFATPDIKRRFEWHDKLRDVLTHVTRNSFWKRLYLTGTIREHRPFSSFNHLQRRSKNSLGE